MAVKLAKSLGKPGDRTLSDIDLFDFPDLHSARDSHGLAIEVFASSFINRFE